MLSKCLNPHCSEKFRYLSRGRLYRIDFMEMQRRIARADGAAALLPRGRRESVEHFWLCDRCALTLTIEADGDGEVRLVPVPRDAGNRPPAADAEESTAYELLADAS